MGNLLRMLLGPLLDNVRSGRIEVGEEGLKVAYPKAGEFRIRWDQIVRIVAMKRDLLTTDLVCFQIFYKNDSERVVELNEETKGFEDLTRALETRNMIDQSWRQLVVRPAFEPNTTVLFEVSS